MTDPFRCRICGVQCGKHAHLVIHFNQHHSSSKLFKYPRCNTSYAGQLNTMNRHFNKLCRALPTATTTAAVTTATTNAAAPATTAPAAATSEGVEDEDENEDADMNGDVDSTQSAPSPNDHDEEEEGDEETENDEGNEDDEDEEDEDTREARKRELDEEIQKITEAQHQLAVKLVALITERRSLG